MEQDHCPVRDTTKNFPAVKNRASGNLRVCVLKSGNYFVVLPVTVHFRTVQEFCTERGAEHCVNTLEKVPKNKKSRNSVNL